MKTSISRRTAIKLVTAATVAGSTGCVSTHSSQARRGDASPTKDNWSKTHDRVWLGGEYWANPMEDWRIVDGGAECLSYGGNRSVHSLTHQLTDPSRPFSMSVTLARLDQRDQDGGGGFRLGVRSDINEYKSNCFVQQGLDVGIIDGSLQIASAKKALSRTVGDKAVKLVLKAEPKGDLVSLRLTATFAESGAELGSLAHDVPSEDLSGNVAVVSNFATPAEAANSSVRGAQAARYRFSDWEIQGPAFSIHDDQRFGPILWTMYSLSDSRSTEGFVMKLSAFTGPMGEKDSHAIELHIQKGSEWVLLDTADLDQDGWVATFRIPNWEEVRTVPYRVVYRERHRDGSETPDIWEGRILANPVGRPMKMAALTCQNDYGFPYAPVADNVVKLQPDLVFFSGDQIYESHGGFGIIREPAEAAIHNYLRKFYQFGWAFREAMRNQPTLCLPDDHDVLQGNLWGEGGAAATNLSKDPSASIIGGYVEPVRVVNAVHRTTLAHHPDAYDPTPMPRGISVYFGDMVYGDVSFAILADRQWKSAPERIGVEVGVTGNDEAPLNYNPKFNPEGLELLGARQEKFLEQWAKDWRGHKLKAVLSQTVFAGIATHQPLPDRYLKYDFDGSGWPSRARNRAVELMRPSMALHICGDTHLGTLSQYGVDQQRDSNWAFCTPAISAGWPRWWRPDAVGIPHANRPKHGLPQTGEYLDSFGNKIYVYAAGNPDVGTSPDRYAKAHQKGSGFGVITFDTENLSYTMEAYRFLVDVTDGKKGNQFPGWPVTIYQEENAGKNRLS